MLSPIYKCSYTENFSTDAFPCIPHAKKDKPDVAVFCDSKPKMYPRVNYTNDESLDNWFEQIDLKCESGAQIGLVGSM